MARNAEFRTPFDGAYLGRVFPSFAVPVCLGAAGRRGSVWHAVQTIWDPRWAPPWHWEVHRKTGARRGVWMWDWSAKGFLPLGMGAASAPLDVTASASFPLRGKSVTTSTHRHPHTYSARHARARVTHVMHLWPARVSVALCTVS